MTTHDADSGRYDRMVYRRCPSSGLSIPVLSLGLWLNFGDQADYGVTREIVLGAFDRGITHMDLANNYGPPPGAAEVRFGTLLARDLKPYRDELVISTKAGYLMWPGPYGDGGSRKYLMASCDQSLARLGIDYVDIFYHHRPDPHTPLDETMDALADIVKSGKALYAGISNYHPDQARRASALLRARSCPCVLDQVRYSLLDRHVEEEGLLETAAETGMGIICFSPLAQGLLTDKYLDGRIPEGSRPTHSRFLSADRLDAAMIAKLNKLAAVAEHRGQSLSQMAISWLLKDNRITSVLVGASSLAQLDQNLGILDGKFEFESSELREIDAILAAS